MCGFHDGLCLFCARTTWHDFRSHLMLTHSLKRNIKAHMHTTLNTNMQNQQLCVSTLIACFSSDPCEAVGHRPAVLSDYHDENRTHQTLRVHGLPEEVIALRDARSHQHTHGYSQRLQNQLNSLNTLFWTEKVLQSKTFLPCRCSCCC